MSPFTRLLFSGSSFLTFFLLLSSSTQAKSPAEFGQQYNLFVNEQNQSAEIPYEVGESVLQGFFSQVPLKSNVQDTDHVMSQRDFLIQFERLRLSTEQKFTTLTDQEIYHQSWLRARRNNWLPEPKMTYLAMQEFLYRYEVSKSHGMAYFEGLVLNISEINLKQFSSLAEIKKAQEDLVLQISKLRRIITPSTAEKNLQTRLETYYIAFDALREELKRLEHPLNKIPNLPEDIKNKIIDNDLNQILNQMTYYYGGNTYNRQFNLIRGAMQINGRVFQPGEDVSFVQVLKDAPGGLSGYMYGWTIQGLKERWEYGGGLCGSATMFFTPTWRAGLEVVARRGHSSYYSDLYPKDSMGLDATIYFGSTDVIMKNSTDSPILYYVHDNKESKEVTLYLIGNSPYAKVEIEGPIKTGYNSFRYIRHMTKPDGTVVSEDINTRYSRIY